MRSPAFAAALITAPVAAALLLSLGASPAAAQNKPGTPACGIKDLPLAEGNWWTYEPVNPSPTGLPAAPLKVEVMSVDKDGKSATITLKETYREVEFEMTATCTSAGIVLPAESFFFSGEPGGVSNMTVENLVHKGTSFPARLKSGSQWFEEIRFDVKRQATEGTKAVHDDAKVELERLATVAPGQQVVDTGIQTYRSTPIEFEMRGRALIGEKTQEIAVRENGVLWIYGKIGVVRTREVSGVEWQLTDTNLVKK